MAHGAAAAHMYRQAPFDVHHAVILNICTLADGDLILFRTKHRPKKDAAVGADTDIAHHRGGRRYKYRGMDLRFFHGILLLSRCAQKRPASSQSSQPSRFTG